jgi:hypothetical protein
MKSSFSLLIFLFIIVSCGKYEKPFISFRSPEKRLMNKTWTCVKAINENGTEIKIIDKIKFEISGEDSIYTRITNHQPLYLPNTSGNIDTVIGTWTWLYALKGKLDKQKIRLIYSGSNSVIHNGVINISILTKKEFEYQDVSFDNSTYSYEAE